jgi:hypothetical protein
MTTPRTHPQGTAPAAGGRRTPLLGLATTTLAVLLLAGCSGGGDADSAAGEAAGGTVGGGATSDRSVSEGAPGSPPTEQQQGTGGVVEAVEDRPERKVSTGTVSLESDDVAATRSDVQVVVDQLDGEVAEDSTETDDRGRVLRSRIVLRVPAADFDEAMHRLEKAADLVTSDQRSETVTDQYVDLQARVRAQEKSLERVELLFTRARDIGDVMAIEAQLTQRQADLDSLKGQLRFLDDRTTMSTITVHVERTPQKTRTQEDEAGFLVGLAGGWQALGAATVAVATVAGALLPFLVLAAVAGVPLWLLLRSRRRRAGRPGPTTPDEVAPAE